MPVLDVGFNQQHETQYRVSRERKEDYTVALSRAQNRLRRKSSWHPDMSGVYEKVNNIRQSLHERRSKSQKVLFEELLHEHIQRWRSETMHWSSMTRRIAHPSYLRIIGLANKIADYEVERTLLHEFQIDPDHWFAALSAITGENPVRPEHNFDEAIAAWLTWGREKGIV